MSAQSVRVEFFLLAAIWGSSFLLMRLGAADFGPWATAGLRVAVASAFLGPILWLLGKWPDLRRHYRAILFVGLLNSALPFVLFAYAVQHVSTGLTAILNAVTPLMGALVAWAWLHEQLDRWRLWGLLLGFMGVVLLSCDKFAPGSSDAGLAVLASLGATFCYGLSASITKKYLTGVQPLAIAAGSQFGATLALTLPTLYHWPQVMPGATAWCALLALGVVCSGIAYILFFRQIHHLGPSKAMTVTFLVPLFAMAYGVVLLDETITPAMLIGGLVTLLGVALAMELAPRVALGTREKSTLEP